MALADSTALVCMSVSADFGLAPGGLLRQQIYADDYGIDAWDRQVQSRCFVHILNSQQYRQVTGKRPPHEPPTAQAYTQANLPWFEYFNADMKPVAGSEVLGKLDSVAALGVKKSQEPLLQNDPITPSVVVPLASGARPVREGEF
jgi:hypothetical protein